MTDETAGENTYIVDAESPAETARLINLDRIITQTMGGPLVGIDAPDGLRNILDLGCGPGGWVLDVAFALPDAEVEGVDISRVMVDYANARALTQSLPNASFGVMNITQPLDFPDASFDLVNARFLTGVLRRDRWPGFMAECTRLLRPGGTIRLTELIDSGISTSPAFERLQHLIYQALWQNGYGFSIDGRTLGMTHALPRMLRAAGYQQLRHMGFGLEFSVNTPGWIDFYRNAEIGYRLGQAFYINAGVTTQEEFEQLYQQMLIEMHSDDFFGMWHYMTFIGTRP
jgi:ubiquinone/menaquinone biosynthesis C-methylase UbiE